MSAASPPPHARLVRTALVLTAVTMVTSLGLPQQQERLSGSILGDIGAGIESAISGLADAVQNLFALGDGPEDADSDTGSDDVPPLPKFLFTMMAQESGWESAADASPSFSLDDDGFATADAGAACRNVGDFCTEDGADADGTPLVCRNFFCVRDDASADPVPAEFGEWCDSDSPCAEEWECSEGLCLDPLP